MKRYLCFACCLMAGCGSNDKDKASRIELVPMEVIEVRSLEKFPVEEKFTGVVEASRTAQLAFEVPGTVVSIAFDEGETVEKGATIAVIDTERLKAQRNQVEASLAQAEASRTFAASEYRRDQRLFELDAATGQQLERKKEAIDSANAAIEQINSQLAAIDVDLGKSELKAPFPGTISQRMIDEGAVVSPNQPAFALLETGALEVRVAMNLGVKNTMTAGTEIIAELSDGERLEMPVDRVLPQRDSRTRTTDVILSLADQETGLKPGDLVTVIALKMVEENGFLVPRSALTESSRGLWSCYISMPAPDVQDEAERITRTDLEIIHEYTDSVVARGGVTEGDRIIATGLQKVSAGQFIRVVNKLEPLTVPGNE